VIDTDHINAALEVLNPQNDAVRTIATNFGNAEAAPLVGDIMGNLGINVESLRDFAATQFAYYIEEGDPPELAAAKVEALILGFNLGVAACNIERGIADE